MPKYIKLFCFWGLLSLALPLMADDKPCKSSVTVRVYDAVVIYTVPGWVPDGVACKKQTELLLNSKFERKQDGPVFFITQAPQGQNFKNWKQLYSLNGLYDSEQKISLKHFVHITNTPLKKFCKKGYYRQSVTNHHNNQLNLEIQCGRFKAFANNMGYRENMGEVAIFKFIKYKKTLIKVYQEWRGPQFRPSKKSTWPVTQKVYKMMQARLNGVRAISPTIKKSSHSSDNFNRILAKSFDSL